MLFRSVSQSRYGASINLGPVKLSEELHAIESDPAGRITNTAEVQDMLEKSIYWLNFCLTQIFQDIAV